MLLYIYWHFDNSIPYVGEIYFSLQSLCVYSAVPTMGAVYFYYEDVTIVTDIVVHHLLGVFLNEI